MTRNLRQGSIGALLDAFERAITDLQQVIADIDDDELAVVVDNETNDTNCISVQTVLTHVVSGGYAHGNYIRQLSGVKNEDHVDVIHFTKAAYYKALDDIYVFMIETFKNVEDRQLEELDSSSKVITSWGQSYDMEQMMEHAIVHVMKHRRQLEKFKRILANKPTAF